MKEDQEQLHKRIAKQLERERKDDLRRRFYTDQDLIISLLKSGKTFEEAKLEASKFSEWQAKAVAEFETIETDHPPF